MIKGIVVASDFSQYMTYLRNRGMNRAEYGFYQAGKPDQLRALDKNEVKVLWLEGWSENEKMTNSDIQFLKLFKKQQTVSEVWIYGQGSFF